MSEERICVDLCCGNKGFSQAFKAGGWDVITVDIEPKFNPTVCADVTKIDWSEFKRTFGIKERSSIMLMSPDCARFSLAQHTWPKPGIQRAMELVGACLEGVAALRPYRWILENPKGRLRWFLGTPKATIRLCDYGAPWQKLTDLWGDFELGWLRTSANPTLYLRPMKKYNRKYQSSMTWIGGANRAKRAEMPLGLSQAILESVEAQGSGGVGVG